MPFPLETMDARALAAAPSVRELTSFPKIMGLGDAPPAPSAPLVADPVSGILGAISGIVNGLASGANAVPNIAAAFGGNKQVKEQNKLQEEAIAAQQQIAQSQAQAAAVSSASWAATARTAAPYVGGALLIGAAAWGASKLWKRGRR